VPSLMIALQSCSGCVRSSGILARLFLLPFGPTFHGPRCGPNAQIGSPSHCSLVCKLTIDRRDARAPLQYYIAAYATVSAEAVDLCRRAVDITRAAFGEEDSRYAVNVNNYALALCPLGNLAARFRERA
jgi:hypothetical protein